MNAVFSFAVLALLLAAAGFISVLPAKGADLLSEQRFTEVFVSTLHDQAPALTLHEDGPLRLTARDATGKEFHAFLDNAWNAYRQDPEALDSILRTYSAGLVATWRQSDIIDPTRIVPVVKDAAYVPDIAASMVSRGAKPDWRPVFEPYNAELVILYAEDTELTTRYMSEEELANSGFPTEGRLRLAMANLKPLLGKVQVYDYGGFYQVTAGGDYDASLLLFDRLWKNLKLPLKGEPVAAIPARNILVVTGSEDAEGLAAMKREIAEVMAGKDHTLTDRLFVFRGDRFVPYL